MTTVFSVEKIRKISKPGFEFVGILQANSQEMHFKPTLVYVEGQVLTFLFIRKQKIVLNQLLSISRNKLLCY